MCGRFALTSDADTLAAEFGIAAPAGLRPRYNIAPTQEVMVIRSDASTRRASAMRWGLIPLWAKDRKIGNQLINARAETVAVKPAFRDGFRSRRCLVPADGYYEWQARGGGKQPFFIFSRAGGPFAIAGLWASWTDEGGAKLESCILLTCAANAAIAPIHDRMPVVVDHHDYSTWLDPSTGRIALDSLLKSAPEDRFAEVAVSTTVNSPRNESAECIRPVARG